MLQFLAVQYPTIIVVLVCGFAIIAGTWRERLGGCLYLAAYTMAIGFGTISTRYTAAYMTTADSLLLPGFWIIARRTPHMWAKCLLAVQAIGVTIDIVSLCSNLLNRWQYLTIVNAVGYAVLACLLVGTFGAWARRRREKAGSGQIKPAKGDDGSA
jgi:hypothetical protein